MGLLNIDLAHSARLEATWFKSNEISCIYGHVGAGKTSLIELISLTSQAESGEILLDGKSLLKQDCSTVFKDIYLFKDLTIQEHINIVQSINNNDIEETLIEDLLRRFHLQAKKHAIIKDLHLDDRVIFNIILSGRMSYIGKNL